ncbi:PREDICTED: uncharacterized protein LOC104781357 [Camelina sativa]|uniref:Uncharacterized protein LOC104781357 n=1 Tax=Camelina sativa TaxID=90675 RepID=A0ABM0YQ85_CAMSA|nr:PREDICTED: uncharacterized protein LOC104781357 [Camelina sativa]XP_010504317.1 PREDICTED: uncharacterized protein LOC104781357 [Camelina sativa]
MELYTANCLSNENKPTLELSKLVKEEKTLVKTNSENNLTLLVNHGAKMWQENREKWVGDQSRQRKNTAKDQIISWSTTYEDLLSTHEPFSESIPLPEMVDFLVDIWYDEGLYD